MEQIRHFEIDLDPSLVGRDPRRECFVCHQLMREISTEYHDLRGNARITILNVPGYRCVNPNCLDKEPHQDFTALVGALRGLRGSLPIREFPLSRDI